MNKYLDKKFLYTIITLVVVGFFIFLSAAMSTLGEPGGFLTIFTKQFTAVILGAGALVGIAYSKKINHKEIRKYSPYIFIVFVIFQLFVFIPGIGVEVNGSNRWVNFGFGILQPSEFLKIAFVLFFSALVATHGKKLKKAKNMILPAAFTLGPIFLILFVIKDIGTLLVLCISAFAILLVSESKNTHLFAVALGGIIILFALVFFFRPHAWDRLVSFSGVSEDALGSDWQVNQSIYTIGSGEIFGRGFGKSIQKFTYLPEEMTDSIYAVASEEWGFFGSILLIILYLYFIKRGLYIAKNSKDAYSKYVVLGLVMMIGAQSFLNMATMLKLFPLSGMPLIFISKGGSAILASLIACGIILNFSKYIKRTK